MKTASLLCETEGVEAPRIISGHLMYVVVVEYEPKEELMIQVVL
jgi:hypothetical protein